MDLALWPAFNAILNSICAVLLVCGYVCIRQKNIPAHKRCMLSAFACSVLFLVSYLAYHYVAGSTKFQGQGAIRSVYFAILISHTILAAGIVPPILMLLRWALRGEFARHRRLARWTLPVWLYVSITGVIVYLMLYQLDFS